MKAVRLGSRAVVWEEFLEDLSAPSLSFDRDAKRWRVVGWADDESIVRVEGVIGTPGVERKRWPTVDTDGSYVDALTAAGPEALVVEKRYDRGLWAHLMPRGWTWVRLLPPYREVSRYATIGDHGRRTHGESKLAPECTADALDDGLACTVYDGARTHIVKIDGGTGHVEGIGFLDDYFVSDRHAARGWLTGWTGSGPVAIRLSTGEALHLPERSGTASQLSVSNDRLVALMFGDTDLGDTHLTVRLYALPPRLSTSRQSGSGPPSTRRRP